MCSSDLAIKDQAEKLAFIGPGYAVDVRSEAAKAVVEASGLNGAKVFFTNAGAESNENAIKMAKMYTKRWKIFSMYRCYHGSSAGSGMLTGEPRHFANEPDVRERIGRVWEVFFDLWGGGPA